MKIKAKTNILSLVISACIIAPLTGQAYQSLQPHDGRVNILASKADEQSFFSAGEDGFLIKWQQNGQEESSGERYQISDMPIKLLDLAPADSDLAVYESDGLSTNRIAVYDWTSYNRRFAKRFKNTVTCLSYSANGSYLFVATAAVNGIYILNPKTGDVIKNIKTIPGVITMAKTGTSEKTAIMYSPSGVLYYWDLKKGNVKVRFSTEAALQQPCLFGSGKFQNRFFAGVNDNTIYIIDATNGNTLASYKARNPKICCCEGDYEEGLFYVSDRGRDYSLSLISKDSLEGYLTASSGSKKAMPA
ncbi:MAG: WD40 repeat domain-containing protein, partial [Treponema sp.]|nr:WD40 repeat domain-containing protein [Treponema sp.]